MFSNRIANSAKFLQMPSEAQLFYFHLCLRADDDGIAEAYPLIKLLGTPPDAFKVLLARGFVQQLNEDQVVVVTDWLEHNVIRADRKVDSIYKSLLPAGIKTLAPKPRSDVEDNSKRVGGQSTDGIGKVRLGKDRIVIHTAPTSGADDLIPDLIKAFEAINPACKKYYSNKTQRDACNRLITEYGFERVKTVIEKTLPKSNGKSFFPIITTPHQLFEKWATLESAIHKHNDKNRVVDKLA